MRCVKSCQSYLLVDPESKSLHPRIEIAERIKKWQSFILQKSDNEAWRLKREIQSLSVILFQVLGSHFELNKSYFKGKFTNSFGFSFWALRKPSPGFSFFNNCFWLSDLAGIGAVLKVTMKKLHLPVFILYFAQAFWERLFALKNPVKFSRFHSPVLAITGDYDSTL